MSSADAIQMCPTCRCCELVPEDCDACGGEGVLGHECGEDTCCCLDPEENVPCDYCFGRGWFWVCVGGCEGEKSHRLTAAIREAPPRPEGES